jgi:uncharacterized protein (TIGR03435 family)
MILEAALPLLLFSQEFEVASVRPSVVDTLENSTTVSQRGDVRVVNLSLHRILQLAYGLHESQVLGGPRWIATDRWTIDAKSAEDDSSGKPLLKLQSLLKKRFGLAVRSETRQMSALRLSQSKGGHKLATASDGAEMRLSSGEGAIIGTGFPMAALAKALADVLERVVVDETGLSGNFDFDLQWSEDESVFEALQSRLGLKLEARKGPVPVLVVAERAERPGEN